MLALVNQRRVAVRIAGLLGAVGVRRRVVAALDDANSGLADVAADALARILEAVVGEAATCLDEITKDAAFLSAELVGLTLDPVAERTTQNAAEILARILDGIRVVALDDVGSDGLKTPTGRWWLVSPRRGLHRERDHTDGIRQ